MKHEGTRFVEDSFPEEVFDGSCPKEDVSGRADGNSSSVVDDEARMFGSAVLSELMARIEFMSGSSTPFDRFCASLRKLIHAVRR